MTVHEGKESGVGDLVLLDNITDESIAQNLKLRYGTVRGSKLNFFLLEYIQRPEETIGKTIKNIFGVSVTVQILFLLKINRELIHP